ncbi:MAG: hypothetical protein LBN39_10080 [Planctomycetaceae bacterium]|jgi:type II secretory pathway pseudopilin PulG|nr:hypothetical protein [Planctomycetaceae bacterium]
MRDLKNLQIAIICLVIVVIGLIVALVMMNQGNDERLAREKKAQEDAKAAQEKERTIAKDYLTLKQFAGLKDDASAEDVQKVYNDAVALYSKDTDDASKNFLAVMKNQAAELAAEKGNHAKTLDEKLRFETDYNNLNALYETVLDKFTKEKTKAVEDLAAARKDFEGNLATLRKEIAAVKSDADDKVAKAEESTKVADKKAEEASIKAKQTQVRNNGLAEQIDGLRRASFERPDGKILSVNQTSSTVIVDLGSDDGLQTRMTFSVYAPTITGISFGEHDPEADVQICEVCKRDMAQSTSKASIEIIKILGPHKAEGRILDDMLTNPIAANDVVYTPVWSPGQKQRFALAAGMRIPGVGSRDGITVRTSDLEEIKRLIEANRGEVDCYISEGGDERYPVGEVVGKITENTSFLVVGELNDEDQQDQKKVNANSQLREEARELAVRVITLRELLVRMGWKNVTPVRGFGSRLNESDVAITPEGGRPLSTGLVSPVYQEFNARGRIGMEDRGTTKSTGLVSPLYNESAAPPAVSTGRTSDLFRQRRPVSDITE